MDEFSNIFGNKLEDAKSKDEVVFKGENVAGYYDI